MRVARRGGGGKGVSGQMAARHQDRKRAFHTAHWLSLSGTRAVTARKACKQTIMFEKEKTASVGGLTPQWPTDTMQGAREAWQSLAESQRHLSTQGCETHRLTRDCCIPPAQPAHTQCLPVQKPQQQERPTPPTTKETDEALAPVHPDTGTALQICGSGVDVQRPPRC